jgi:16S rRNA (uracil1498-N3)-methyltransferase
VSYLPYRNNGEYLCRIESMSDKKRVKEVHFRVLELQRSVSEATSRAIVLVCAPIRKARMKSMIEKATELNVSEVVPLITQYTDIHAVDWDALQTCMVQASEQCERLTLPTLSPSVSIAESYRNDHGCLAFQSQDGINRFYLVCCARSDSGGNVVLPLKTALEEFFDDSQNVGMPLAVVVGPEGGFSESDFSAFTNKKNVRFVSLGYNVLRAETAATVALGHIHVFDMLRELEKIFD